MTRLARILGELAVVAMVAATSSAHADGQDTIDYRRHVMKTMGEEVAAITLILQQKAPPDDLATHVRALAVTATTAKQAFEPQVEGGDAKPEVWKNWADFAKRLDALVKATDELAQTAAESDLATVAAKAKSALTCKSCHDVYRVPKKKAG